MNPFTVIISPEAQDDIYNLNYHIVNVYKAPYTAEKYLTGLYRRIASLSTFAASIRPSDKAGVQRFGAGARCIHYKKMAIIYTLHHSMVVVRAVIPGASIGQ